MKRLWTMIPPCMSDILGLQALVNNTDGVAIVHDASAYKPLRFTQGGAGRPENRRGPGGKHNGYFGTQRVVSSEVREANVITGTAEQVWTAVNTGVEVFHPAFLLLATAPCVAMIGSDLSETADRVRSELHLPAASVNLVVNLSGLRLARYMEAEFGTPYVIGAPFGGTRCARLLEELKTGERPPFPEGARASRRRWSSANSWRRTPSAGRWRNGDFPMSGCAASSRWTRASCAPATRTAAWGPR